MKGLICYYSGSGNTKLACQYIAKNVKNIEFDFFDIVKNDIPKLDQYVIVGFATFTDFWGLPYLFYDFINKLPFALNKPAFIFNTYGFISGKTIKIFEEIVTTKGYIVLSGHSLKTPESYPPMRAKGMGNDNAPNEKEINRFKRFISDLDGFIYQINIGDEIKKGKINIGLINHLLPKRSRTKARKDMGKKFVDNLLCTECGTCKNICPYNAINLNPKPIFELSKCYGCWSCYNHCPSKAIYTKNYRGLGHYPKPIDKLKEKLNI